MQALGLGISKTLHRLVPVRCSSHDVNDHRDGILGCFKVPFNLFTFALIEDTGNPKRYVPQPVTSKIPVRIFPGCHISLASSNQNWHIIYWAFKSDKCLNHGYLGCYLRWQVATWILTVSGMGVLKYHPFLILNS